VFLSVAGWVSTKLSTAAVGSDIRICFECDHSAFLFGSRGFPASSASDFHAIVEVTL
jgi:hypothetical protein